MRFSFRKRLHILQKKYLADLISDSYWFLFYHLSWNAFTVAALTCEYFFKNKDFFNTINQLCKENEEILKGTVMQIEKALNSDHVCLSKVYGKLCIPTIYTFTVVYPWNLLFS